MSVAAVADLVAALVLVAIALFTTSEEDSER